MKKKQKIILKGIPASIGKVKGRVKIVNFCEEIDEIGKDEIIVTPFLVPDFLAAIKKDIPILGIISDKGGLTCHAAIIARELKIPYIAGARIATKKLKNDMLITMNGGNGLIY